ncbi:MAG: guanylate kinase [bacterium]|nr:guanylate kinase [bacterium]
MKTKGILVVISGFSGAGKGTLVTQLLERYSNYALSVSATTRSPRQGEKDGVHYFFKSREMFEQMIAGDELVEYAEYVGNYYGTPKEYVYNRLEEGYDVILEIEVQGAFKIKEKFPDAVLIFVAPPSAEELLRRLQGRGTETAEKIAERVNRAKEEAVYMPLYNQLLVNDDLETAVAELHALIQSKHNDMSRNMDFVTEIQEELSQL